MKAFKLQLLRYWAAMNASAMQAAANAGKAFIATATGHSLSETIPALTLNQVAAVHLFAFGKACLDYLSANPLPTLPPSLPSEIQPMQPWPRNNVAPAQPTPLSND